MCCQPSEVLGAPPEGRTTAGRFSTAVMSPSTLPLPFGPHPSQSPLDSVVQPFSLTGHLFLRHHLGCFQVSFRCLGRQALPDHSILSSNFLCFVTSLSTGLVFSTAVSAIYVIYGDVFTVCLLQHEDTGFVLSQPRYLIVAGTQWYSVNIG